MSGRQRNLNHGEKIVLPRTRQLPEVICESPLNSPGSNFGEEINAHILETLNYKAKLQYNSTTSSAQSQRFQDMFYNTDWPSLSDTGTDSPDCIELEGSDSSASSMFSWADAEGTKMVCEEWEKIQRTLYNEDGPKVTQKHLIEECNQWNTIFPHLRIIGRSCGLSNLDNDDSYDTEEEVLALHYDSDAVIKEVLKAPFMMSEQFSQDTNCQKLKPLMSRKKSSLEEVSGLFPQNDIRSKSSTTNLVEELDSFLHITPIIQNSSNNNYTFGNQSSAIIKSEISSSRWRQRNTASPDFVSLPHQIVYGNSTQTRDSSAASLFSLAGARKNIININHNALTIDTKINKSSFKSQNSEKWSKQNISEKHCHLLEPLEPLLANKILQNRSITIPQARETIHSGGQKGRNVSLPPIQSDENKGRRKQFSDVTFSGKSTRRNKTTLIPLPINFTPNSIPKHNSGGDFNTFSLINDRSVASKKSSNGKKSSKKKNS